MHTVMIILVGFLLFVNMRSVLENMVGGLNNLKLFFFWFATHFCFTATIFYPFKSTHYFVL